jgi:hypothetical protein
MNHKREKKSKKMNLVGFFVMLASIFIIISGIAFADVSVRGYYRSNGTYVQPHYRSNPDGNVGNNWSTYGNVNPYTGEAGTRHW